MYIILNCAGHRLEAVVLAVEPGSLRVAIEGRDDVEILNQAGGQWWMESGEPVELESLVAGDHTAIGSSSKYFVTSERYQARTDNVARCISSSCSPKHTRHSRPGTVLTAGIRATRTGTGMD